MSGMQILVLTIVSPVPTPGFSRTLVLHLLQEYASMPIQATLCLIIRTYNSCFEAHDNTITELVKLIPEVYPAFVITYNYTYIASLYLPCVNYMY